LPSQRSDTLEFIDENTPPGVVRNDPIALAANPTATIARLPHMADYRQ
jgi:hypothetical protein